MGASPAPLTTARPIARPKAVTSRGPLSYATPLDALEAGALTLEQADALEERYERRLKVRRDITTEAIGPDCRGHIENYSRTTWRIQGVQFDVTRFYLKERIVIDMIGPGQAVHAKDEEEAASAIIEARRQVVEAEGIAYLGFMVGEIVLKEELKQLLAEARVRVGLIPKED
ncbi:MAG TPA: hypothetical protein VNI57_01445 [Candidatus Saccharimonadales bacterium]|nr:hypothetical protein [Candidatus Saccharimonadales bacterium]